jgi:hypothetical protein
MLGLQELLYPWRKPMQQVRLQRLHLMQQRQVRQPRELALVQPTEQVLSQSQEEERGQLLLCYRTQTKLLLRPQPTKREIYSFETPDMKIIKT